MHDITNADVTNADIKGTYDLYSASLLCRGNIIFFRRKNMV